MQLTYVLSELRNGLRSNITMTLAAVVTITAIVMDTLRLSPLPSSEKT